MTDPPTTALSPAPDRASPGALDAAQRRSVRRNLRMAARGVAFSAVVAGVVVSGVLPMSATAGSTLLGLAAALAFTRGLRGLWAVRVARTRFRGWRRRNHLPTPSTPADLSADEQAILLLTQSDEPLVGRAREQGRGLARQMSHLRALLEDRSLSPVLRRPVAEALTRTEGDLESLLDLLAELGAADAHARRTDLLQRLAAQIEVDRSLPAGLLASA